MIPTRRARGTKAAATAATINTSARLFRLDLDSCRARHRGDEQPPLPTLESPAGQRKCEERDVDRKRDSADAALDVPPELWRESEQDQPRRERSRPHNSPEQSRDGGYECRSQQRQLRRHHAYVERACSLDIETRHDRPPERVVGYAERDVLTARNKQASIEAVVPEREPFRQPDPPRVVEPGGRTKSTDDPEQADGGD